MIWMNLIGQSLSRTCNATGLGNLLVLMQPLKLREQTRNSQSLPLVRTPFSVRLSLFWLPEHDLVDAITSPEQAEAVADYKHQASLKSDLARTDLAKEKQGFGLVLMPSTLSMARKFPIWIADYVLASYGTGAVMAVPAHDQRDWEFAKQFDLPIVEVLEGGNVEEAALHRRWASR